MSLQVGNIHFPTLVAAVVVILGLLALIGLILRLLKKI